MVPALYRIAGKLRRILGGVSQEFLLRAEFLGFLIGDQRVGNVSKRALNRLLIGQHGFLLLRLRQTNVGANFPRRENGLRDRSGKSPQAGGAAKQTRERRALKTGRRGQRNVGKISGPGDPDPGIGRNQLLLGLPDVRAALQQRGGKPGRNLSGRVVAR